MDKNARDIEQADKPQIKKRRRFNALDVCLIIAAALLLVGAGLRIYIVKNGALPGQTVTLEKYAVSFLVKDVRETSAEQFTVGSTFYIQSSVDVFGTIMDTVSVTPAELYIEDSDGNVTLTYTVDDSNDGEDGRVDIRGTVLSEGYMSDTGFLIGGTTYIAPNLCVAIQSQNVLVLAQITDITKIEQ